MNFSQFDSLRRRYDEYKQLKQDHPWQWFRPLLTQQKFRRYIADRYQVVGFFGGNWTGKTITGAATSVELAMTGGLMIDGEFFQVCPLPNMGRVATEKENVEKDVVKNLKSMMGDNVYQTEKKGRPFESQWDLMSGSTFDIMTYDQRPKQFEGVELDWAWLNEPCTEAQFRAILGRFKRGGVLFLTATILSAGWILDEIIEGENPNYRYVFMDIDENRQSKGGFLPDEAVDKMLDSQDSEYREARKTGRALKLAGRVFKNYEPVRHFKPIFENAPEDAEVVMATDPHDRIPHYSLWGYVDKDKRLVLYREHPQDDFWEYTDNPIHNETELAHTYTSIEDIEPALRLLDRKFGAQKKFGSEFTVLESMQNAGLDYETWESKNRQAHNIKIRSWLAEDRIVVSARCANLHKALMRHRFLEQASDRAKDEKGKREDVDEKHRHPIDCLAAIIEAVDSGLIDSSIRDVNTLETEGERIRRQSAKQVFGESVVLEDVYYEDDEWDDDGYGSLMDI